MSYQTRSGQRVAVGQLLARGGEGEVFAVSSPPGTVFKRYLPVALNRDPQLEDRLRAMIAQPPAQWREPQSGHVTLTWPTDLVLENGRFAGFLMAAVEMSETVELHRVTNADDRHRASGKTAWVRNFTWKYLIHAAANLAQATQMLHEAGVVIGDFNERNSRVTRDARITLLDCDSMQISDAATRGHFFCRVGRPEFTPPELIHADWSKTVRHPSSDLFALAIHIYQFLLEGEHPFRGVWNGPGDKPSVNILAAQGTWAHQGGGMLHPRPSAIPADMLPRSIMSMFGKAFEDGAVNPGARPTARAWHQALTDLEASLRRCPKDASHFYPGTLHQCPWCQHTVARTASMQMRQRPSTPTSAMTQSALAPAPQPTITYRPVVVPAQRQAPVVPVTTYTPLPVNRPGTRSNKVRNVLIGVGVIVLAAIAIPAAISSAHSGSPGGSGSSPTGSVSSAGGPESTEAAAVHDVLQQSNSSRQNVEQHTGEVQNCSDVSDGDAGLQQDVSDRQNELNEAQNLSVDALPNGDALKTALVGAMQNSLNADNYYLDWANDVGSCSGTTAPSDSNLVAASSASKTAVSYKNQFVALWNQITPDEGYPTLTEQDM